MRADVKVSKSVLYTKMYKDYIVYAVHVHAVGVTLPWPTRTLVPQGSTVLVNCTSSSESSLYWSIRLQEATVDATFINPATQPYLNENSFYELPSLMQNSQTTIQLLVNGTERSNGSRLRCVKGINHIQETRIFVYGKSVFGYHNNYYYVC